MSWTRVLATGSGTLELRLLVEGLQAELVTNIAMERAANPSIGLASRIAAMMREGFVIDEQVDPARAQLEIGSMSVRLLDGKDYDVTTAIAYPASQRTYLAADCSAGAASINVANATGITTNTYVHIGTEAIRVGGVSGTTLTVDRGALGTIAQAHFAELDGIHAPQVVYVDRPSTIEGRRAYLYAYGEGDDFTGAGTLIWRGVCMTDARLSEDGATWEIEIGGLTELHQQDLGAGLEDPFLPRGAYYPWTAPLIISQWDSSTALTRIVITGHYETNADLVAAINTELAAGTSYTGVTLTAVVIGDGWGFDCQRTSAAISNRYQFRATSPFGESIGRQGIAEGLDEHNDDLGIGVGDLTANYVYRYGGGAGTPRGAFGTLPTPTGSFASTVGGRDGQGVQVDPDDVPSSTSDTHERTIYLDRPVSVSSSDAMQITWADDAEPEEEARPVASASTNGTVELGGVAPSPYRLYGPSTLPELRLKRQYSTGGLAAFRSAITSDSPDVANLGEMPFITTSDWGDWGEATEAERGRSVVASRRYVAFDAVKLADFLEEECKLRGIFPCLDSDGKITLRKLQVPTATDPVVATIDEDYHIAPNRPTWERNALGSINTVRILTGYNATEDEHQGRTYVVRDVEAYAAKKTPRTLEIAPYSEPQGGVLTTATSRDFTDLASPVLGVFGRAYAVITVDVDLSLFDVLLGDVVAVSGDHFPNASGTRGATYRGFVIGRAWELIEGRGMLRILAFLDDVYGWAPSAYISGEVDNGSDNWTLTCATTDPTGSVEWFQSGDDMTDHFADGDKVRVTRWNATSSGEVTGTVDSVTTTTITLTFDATWTPGSDDWVLDFQPAGSVESGQEVYMFLGGTDGTVGFSGGDEQREWAP